MARKRTTTPKSSPKSRAPASIPFPEELAGRASGDLLLEASPVIAAARLSRLVLGSAAVEAGPDAPSGYGLPIVEMSEPDVAHHHDVPDRVLQVAVAFSLRCTQREELDGEAEDDGPTLLTIRASFVLDFDLASTTRFTKSQVDAFRRSAAVTVAWPYWREYVRDAASRMGFPPIDVPYDVIF